MLPRVNTLPLGCGALAGHAFGIDREFLREKMGFAGITLNSMVRERERERAETAVVGFGGDFGGGGTAAILAWMGARAQQ